MINFIQVCVLFFILLYCTLTIRKYIMAPVIDYYMDKKDYLKKYFIIELIYLVGSWGAFTWGVVYTYGYFILRDEKCLKIGYYFPMCAIIIGGTLLLTIKTGLKDKIKESEEK